MPLNACMSSGCHSSLAGKVWLTVTPHMSPSGTSASSGRSMLADPELIIIGGSWGSHPVILDVISTAAARLPRHAPVRAAELTAGPSLAGVRLEALNRLRSAIVTTAHRAQSEAPTVRG